MELAQAAGCGPPLRGTTSTLPDQRVDGWMFLKVFILWSPHHSVNLRFCHFRACGAFTAVHRFITYSLFILQTKTCIANDCSGAIQADSVGQWVVVCVSVAVVAVVFLHEREGRERETETE